MACSPTQPNYIADVACAAVSENFQLGFLWGLSGLGHTAYVSCIFSSFCDIYSLVKVEAMSTEIRPSRLLNGSTEFQVGRKLIVHET